MIERAELNANQVNEINIGEEATEAPELDRASSSLVKIYFFFKFFIIFLIQQPKYVLKNWLLSLKYQIAY